MIKLRFNKTSVWRRLRCLVRPFQFNPFAEMLRLREIKKQMDFWHEQERVTMANAFDCLRTGDSAGYEIWRQAHRTAQLRCEKEVREPLGNLKTNS